MDSEDEDVTVGRGRRFLVGSENDLRILKHFKNKKNIKKMQVVVDNDHGDKSKFSFALYLKSRKQVNTSYFGDLVKVKEQLTIPQFNELIGKKKIQCWDQLEQFLKSKNITKK